MPDRYDRAICAAELRLMSEILAKIAAGWRPTAAFEVPNTQQDTPGDTQVGPESDSASVTSTASFLKEEVNIADLDD